MHKAAVTAKRFLDLTLVMLVVGAVWTAFALFDLSEGTIALALPAELVATGGPVEVVNRVVGVGTIDLASGVATFSAPIMSMPGVFYLLTLVLQFAPAFVLVLILRRIAASVVAGEPFADANVGRIRALGGLTIVFWFLLGALQWGLETWVAATSTVQGFGLGSSGGWNYYVSLLGVVVIGLAEVFRYGKQLQSDADLTV